MFKKSGIFPIKLYIFPNENHNSPDYRAFSARFLHLHSTHHSLFAKVNANGRRKLRMEYAIGVLIQEAGLAHTRIAQRQKFQQIIVFDGQTHG